MSREILPTPPSVVVDGRLQFGTYRTPFEQVNPLDAARGAGLPWPRALKSLRLKEWQAFQLGNERWFAFLALFDAKLLALVQLKIYDRERRNKVVVDQLVSPWAFTVASGVLDSETSYRASGCAMAFRHRLREGRIDISFEVAASGSRPALRGELRALAADHEPLTVCIPFGPNRGMVSHKGLCPLTGELDVGAEHVSLRPESSWLLRDDHKGYYPWRMQWDWVTAAGRDAHGRLLGFNLTHNQSIDEQRFNENACWLDGKLHLLPPVRVERADGPPEIWTIRDQEGRVGLRFEAIEDNRVNINALVVRSRYRGPFGRFSGRLAPEGGPELPIDGLFGMGERMDLRC